MTTLVTLCPLPRLQFSQNGVPVNGGKLFTYAAGTMNKLATYTDQSGTTPNTNPIILDANGQGDCWLASGVAYKLILSPSTDTDPPTNPYWTEDNITSLVAAPAAGNPAQPFEVAPATTPTEAVNLGQLYGLRNRIINGNFAVNQRGYVSGTALSAGTYAHDRWKAGASGCTYTFTTVTNGQQIDITAGSLQQVIEGASMEGGTYTLSWSGTALGSINGSVATSSPITVSGVSSSTNLTVEFGAGTLGEVQLQPGSAVLPFEQFPYGMLIALCQRYYEIMPVVFANSPSSTEFATAFWKVAKRISPTITATLSSGTGTPTFIAVYDGYSSIYQSTPPTGVGTALVTGDAEL